MGRARNCNATGLRNPFQTRGDIDSVPKNIVVIDDDVANVNADAKLDYGVFLYIGVFI
jgi:hypothetical protein